MKVSAHEPQGLHSLNESRMKTIISLFIVSVGPNGAGNITEGVDSGDSDTDSVMLMEHRGHRTKVGSDSWTTQWLRRYSGWTSQRSVTDR